LDVKSEEQKVLLLVGSPKKKQSASYALGTYLLKQLQRDSLLTETLHIYSFVYKKNTLEQLYQSFENSDIIILSIPLYVDSIPSPVIQMMEYVAKKRAENREKIQQFMVIINCGFPEALHNYTAIEICKCFSDECEFNWLGGFPLGGGPIINGRTLTDVGRLGKNARKSLDIIATAINSAKTIPLEAKEIMNKSVIPARIYRFMGNIGWKRQAKEFGVKKKIKNRPY